jgi:hypothetical protein
MSLLQTCIRTGSCMGVHASKMLSSKEGTEVNYSAQKHKKKVSSFAIFCMLTAI